MPFGAYGSMLLTLNKIPPSQSIEMNIIKINKIIAERRQAADDADKIQSVLTGIEKLCTENGFESYASFLKDMNALEGSENEDVADTGSDKTKKSVRKKRAVITQELVDKMKQAVENKGEKSYGEIAASLGISVPSLNTYRENGFKYEPKKKGPKGDPK